MNLNFTARPSHGRMSFEVPGKREGARERNWPWDFPPGSPGAAPPTDPDPGFLATLAEKFPGWKVAWQPVTQRHTLWAPTATGYRLAFYCQNPYPVEWADVEVGGPIPLDNRVFAFLHDSDPSTYGGLKAMKEEVRRRHEKLKRDEDTRRNEWLDEMWHGAEQHSKIRLGYGKSSGDKFSRQVSGEASRDRQIIPY